MSGHAELTGLLADIAAVAGNDAALAVARARGGTLAFIPAAQNLTDAHWLAVAVGIDKARLIADALVSAALGDRFLVPLGPEGGLRAYLRARARAVTEALESGATIDEAARIAGVDRSTVIRAKRRVRDDRQGQLL